MLKKSVTPKDVCNLLNTMLHLDYEATYKLATTRYVCNDAIAKHPTIQVHQYKKDKFPKVGLIGVLNGLFGTDKNGWGIIASSQDDKGKILKFKLLKPKL